MVVLPRTQGIKYTGSKLRILPHIIGLVSELDGIHSVFDGFSGTTRVSQALSQLSYDVTANDLSVWSECFGRCYLLSDKPETYYKEIIDHLNSLSGREGWFTENYGGDESDSKKPFQRKNTMRLDAIRDEIERLSLDKNDESVILTSLILALDAVDSTLGHYVSYLNRWSARSFNELRLQVPHRTSHGANNRVIRGDIFDTIAQDCNYDLAYLDPPYGSNNEKMPPSRVRYASYYHIWTSVILNDRPKLFGRVGRREDSRDMFSSSVFEEFRRNDDGRFVAMDALEKLVNRIKARYVILSYSSGGRATKEELMDIVERNGRLIKVLEVNYKRNVMSTMSWTGEWLNSDGRYCEYLILMEK